MGEIVAQERAKGYLGRELGADEPSFASAHVTAAGAAGRSAKL